jgi:hypothetical protein
MLQPTHCVSKDVFDPASGRKALVAGQHVKVVDLGDHFYVWPVPYDATTKPVTMQPWLVRQNLQPLAADRLID